MMKLVGETFEYVGLSTDIKPTPKLRTQDSKDAFSKFWELDTGRMYCWRHDKGWVEVIQPTDTSVLSALQLIGRQIEQLQRLFVKAHDLKNAEIIEAE